MSDHTDDRTLDQITAAFAALIRGPRLQRLHDVLNARAGVSLDRPAFVALVTLQHAGPLRVSDLAEACSVEISTMSRLVSRLAGDGLVEQAISRHDRRVVMIDLTEAGIDLVQRLRSIRRAAMTEVMAGWSAAERDMFATLLQRFSDGLEQICLAGMARSSSVETGEQR